MPKRKLYNDSSDRVLRSAKKGRTSGSWGSLPMEVRLMILEEISLQKCRGWSSCAAVCREWQNFVERKNFFRLKLKTTCLDELERIVVRQRDLVGFICLNIEFPRYTCRYCADSYMWTCSRGDNTIVRGTLLKLFSILSTWQPAGRLLLELNAFSRSDSEHWFKNYYFGLEHEDGGNLVLQQETTARWHDPDHGWVNGQQVKAPPVSALLRIFSPLCSGLPGNLPEVHAITGLVIRRQLRRQISPETLRILFKRLPKLESVVYEPWHDPLHKPTILEELAFVIRDALPSHVRTLSIFEDSNDQLRLALKSRKTHLRLKDMYPYSWDPLNLPTAFASKSCEFEHLSISYMIDARDFFLSCQPSSTWPNLRSVALTSSLLQTKTHRQEIFTLLQDASLAALRMPQLESMVLWNRKYREACAVIFHRKNASRQATLTWRGTWNLELSHNVIKSWQKVALNSCKLQVQNEPVQGVINSRGDAIYHLRLPSGVIDPVSLWQIRQEGMMHGAA